ncbi:MAG: ribonuclease P protein component [Actinomycetota bacterium]|nr:ribonuclease P protein component [Actinomycetota bacterium]
MIHRIRTRSEFERLERSGRRVRNELLWCSHLPDPSIRPPRVAFAIGRAHGPAVARNRLRRRLRPILSTLAAEGTLPPGHLLVGINRSMSTQVFAASAADLRVQLIDLIAKLVPRQAS